MREERRDLVRLRGEFGTMKIAGALRPARGLWKAMKEVLEQRFVAMILRLG
jgi:hypothetical protein